jgi:hypothetical protein
MGHSAAFIAAVETAEDEILENDFQDWMKGMKEIQYSENEEKLWQQNRSPKN